MENEQKQDDGQEPYIPSVHLKNIAPLEWLKTEEAKKFMERVDKCVANLMIEIGEMRDEKNQTIRTLADLKYLLDECDLEDKPNE